MLFRILLQFIGRYSCGLRFVRLDNYFVYFCFKVTLNWYDSYAVSFHPIHKPQKNLDILSSKTRKLCFNCSKKPLMIEQQRRNDNGGIYGLISFFFFFLMMRYLNK